MKIACIGGGPAGLYLGILVKRQAPEHEVVIYERNRASDTFGFGVVFSDATLGHLAAADPETHAAITARFARWDDIEIHASGEVQRSTGHGFCGIERKQLLQILQARALQLGVTVHYEHEIRALSELADADVVVACDGASSWVRDALAGELAPKVDVRPNKFVWLGCTVPYRAFTFIFKHTPGGLYRVHAYPYTDKDSTFIVECRADTWAREFEGKTEDETVGKLEQIFADELAGHHLVKNRSIWRNFPTVRCGKWHAGNVVLLGDAAHTAHFSIGSGTKLAMEDAIALRDELLAARGTDVSAALAAYEARRRPEVLALQAAAQASLEWFEGTERYAKMPPVQFGYSLMTRSLRVSHASMRKRDAEMASGVEQLFGARGSRPSEQPFTLGDRTWASRTVDPARVARVATANRDEAQIVADVRAAHDADLLLLDPGDDLIASEQLPGVVQAMKAAWRPTGWIAAPTRIPGHAAQLRKAGAKLLWVTGVQLADRLRNDLGLAVAAAGVPDADAAIAAGRADLVISQDVP